MKYILSLLIISFSFSSIDLAANQNNFTEFELAEISRINEELKDFSNEQLIERRSLLMATLNDDDKPINDDEKSALLLELSIVEGLLILAGVIGLKLF